MPNIIPPLLSSTPPPIVDDDEEDEFGDFRAGVDLSFGCDGLSLPPTPEHVQKNRLSEDYNSNNEDQLKIEDKGLEKDFQDIRKHTSNGVVSEISTDTECPVDEIKTNDKHVVTENNLSVENSHKDENVASNSSEIGGNDETNLFQDVNNVFNTVRPNKTDLCNSENNLNGVDLESKALEALKIDDCSTEILDVRKTSAENGDNKVDVDFENQEKTDSDFKESEVAEDEFGGFKDYIESKNEQREPSLSGLDDFDDFKSNINSSEIHSDDHEDFCAFENPPESAEMQKPNCDVDDDFGDFSAALDSSNSWKTTSPNDASGDFEKNPSNLSEKRTVDFDNFGDFEKCTTKSDDTDDFGDFEGSTVPVESGVSLETPKDDEDDFGNFESTKDDADDGFGDFENCPVQTNTPKDDFDDFEKCSVQVDEDDFGDFDSCSTSNDVFSEEKAEEVITSAFPKVDMEEEDYLHTDISENDKVFGLVKDIMETNALKYQWANSSSQAVLLKALNIDIRNILYGPGWNLTVPKFAANVASSPLEPLKPEILTPEVVPTKPTQHSESVASFPTEVPSVQFDWTSAGLTNPLDSQNDDQQPPPGNINLDWNFLEPTKADEWTQKESTASPAHSLNFEVNQDSVSLKSDGEFEPQEVYHEEVVRKEILTNMVPLRETHIYAENPINVQKENVEDDFGDFHMSLPAVAQKEPEFAVPREQKATPPQCLPAEPLKPVVVHSIASATVQQPAKIEWPEPGITEDDIHTIELTYVKPQTKEVEVKPEKLPATTKTVPKKPSVEDDDWTDFISHKETTKTSPEKVQNNLQLSVFNLGNIQPIKPPVPVITPQGLLQTKITSSGTMSPLMSSPVHSHRPQQKQLTVRPPDGYQPSIISQQFSKQFLNSSSSTSQTHSNVSLSNYNLHPSSFGHTDSVFVPNTNHTTNNSSACDDDDWTDFISSQPVPQQQSLSFTPNIIANPNRYDPLREFRLNGDVLNSSGSRKATQKSSVPSVTTLPDLDFVIAKNRTFTKK